MRQSNCDNIPSRLINDKTLKRHEGTTMRTLVQTVLEGCRFRRHGSTYWLEIGLIICYVLNLS